MTGNFLLLRLFILYFFATLLGGCFTPIPYQQDDPWLAIFRERTDNIALSFKTNKGSQTAFYLPPLNSPQDPPEKLAILYPGIETPTLHWMQFINLDEAPSTGYLLIDYPGRGFSEGSMHPEQLYKNTHGALNALAEHFGMKSIDAELSLLGHSFGTGAALQYAARSKTARIVLVAPYNNLREAVKRRLGWFIATIMPAQIDNRVLIKSILDQPDPPRVSIIHGKDDASLPVEMGLELYDVDRKHIHFYEIPGAGHVDILTSHRDLIFQSLLKGEAVMKQQGKTFPLDMDNPSVHNDVWINNSLSGT